MSKYAIRLAAARMQLKDQVIDTQKALNKLTNELMFREPLQDDEDDALLECYQRLIDAEFFINVATEDLKG